MRILSPSLVALVAVFTNSFCYAQQKQSFNLQQLLKENKLVKFSKTLNSLDAVINNFLSNHIS